MELELLDGAIADCDRDYKHGDVLVQWLQQQRGTLMRYVLVPLRRRLVDSLHLVDVDVDDGVTVDVKAGAKVGWTTTGLKIQYCYCYYYSSNGAGAALECCGARLDDFFLDVGSTFGRASGSELPFSYPHRAQ